MKRIKLSEVLDVKRGTGLPSKHYAKSGEYIRLTLGNFDYPNGGFKQNTSKEDIFYIGNVKENYILKKGDIITPLTEQVRGLLGEVARIPESNKYIQSGDIGLVIPIEDKIDKDFAAFLVSSSVVRKQLADSSQQTKIRHTSPERIKNCVAFVPEDISEQKRISQLLMAIDQQIATLKKIRSTLEDLASELFSFWFLQFNFPDYKGNPYKLAGGKMKYNSELKREIPDGWTVGSLFDIAKFTNGVACQKYRPVDEDHKLPVIKIKEMHDGFGENTEYVRDDIDESHIICDGDVIFSWSATLEAMIWSGGKGGLNQHIFKITSDNYSQYFVYEQLKAYIGNFVRMAEARKTTMGHITRDHLSRSKIAIPPSELERTFCKKAESIYANIVNTDKRMHECIELREWLLPMLMNGQVKITN